MGHKFVSPTCLKVYNARPVSFGGGGEYTFEIGLRAAPIRLESKLESVNAGKHASCHEGQICAGIACSHEMIGERKS